MEQGSTEAEWGRALPTVTRIVSHGAVWIAVLVPMFVVLTHEWTAGGDFAAISIRAFQATALQTPLVGMVSTAGSVGHNISDPGPLLFRLLAIPVHIDPAHGALWGAALLGGAAMSVAVEATWSTGRWLGCAIIGLCALDLVWLVPQVFETLMWNAYFPIPFLLVSIVVAWVVCMGGYGWWPVLVATASIAAQAHLFFVLPCVPLVIVAPIAARLVAGRPQRLRWLLIGIVVGVACWLAPLLQNLYAQGNLTAILRGSNGKTLGIVFGLRAVATAGSPWPIWLKHEPSGYFGTLAFLHANPPLAGFIVLALLAVIAIASWRGGHRSLTSLALVALICSIGFTAGLAIFPGKNSLSLDYLIYGLWVLGVLLWTVVGWAVALVIPVAVRRFSSSTVFTPQRGYPWMNTVGVVAVTALLTVGFAAVWPYRSGRASTTSTTEEARYATIREASRAIERRIPRGPVVVAFHEERGKTLSGYDAGDIAEGVAWQLEADGWQPGLFGIQAAYTGLTPTLNAATAIVGLNGLRVVSVVHKPCSWVTAGCLF
jgi:hypothetical protein